MTGSSTAPIVIPIVAVLCLAIWLGLVCYADAHPRWKSQRTKQTGEPGTTGSTEAVEHGEQRKAIATSQDGSRTAVPGTDEPAKAMKAPSHRAA